MKLSLQFLAMVALSGLVLSSCSFLCSSGARVRPAPRPARARGQEGRLAPRRGRSPARARAVGADDPEPVQGLRGARPDGAGDGVVVRHPHRQHEDDAQGPQ